MLFTSRFEEALLYATRVHASQCRKVTAVPYVLHLLAVASLVGENGGNEDQVIAALLHDAPEDQGGAPRLEDIRQRFGEEVAGIVAACSDTLDTPKPPWRERKENHLKHLRAAAAAVLLVTAADKLHNARAIVAELRKNGVSVFERFNGKKEGTLWYYREIAAALQGKVPPPIFDELARTIREMQELAALAPQENM